MIPYRKALYATCGLQTYNILYTSVISQNITNTDVQERKYRRDLAIQSLILFTDIGYSLAKTMTFLMMGISGVMILYSLGIYISSRPIEGWTTTIVFLAVSFFGLFGILTIIIKYLQLLLQLVFKRKYYSFDRIEKMTR